MQISITQKLQPMTALAARLAARHVLLGAGLGVVFAMLGFQWLQGQLGAPMLDMMAAYERPALVERLLLYGEEGRLLHARFTLFLDMVFPLIYGTLFAGLISLAARGTNLDSGVLAVAAVMVLDWAENLQILAIFWGFPDLSDAQIMAASATTQAKTRAIQFVFLWLLGLLAYQLYRRIRR